MKADFLCLLLVCLLSRVASAESERGYDDPHARGGSMVATPPETWPSGLKEPLNIIISNRSDPRVLNPNLTHGGLYNYFEAWGYGGQCLGLHLGGKHSVNLGEGNRTQISMLRYQWFGDRYFGTCLETIYGGGHFRLFHQASSGAYFLEASVEADMYRNHDLLLNAYDLARDYIVGNVTAASHGVRPGDLSSGTVVHRGWRYYTAVTWASGLLRANRSILNHHPKYANILLPPPYHRLSQGETGPFVSLVDVVLALQQVGPAVADPRVQAVGGNVTDGYTAILTVHVERDK